MDIEKAKRISSELEDMLHKADGEIRKSLIGAQSRVDDAIRTEKSNRGTLDTSGLREDPNLY